MENKLISIHIHKNDDYYETTILEIKKTYTINSFINTIFEKKSQRINRKISHFIR